MLAVLGHGNHTRVSQSGAVLQIDALQMRRARQQLRHAHVSHGSQTTQVQLLQVLHATGKLHQSNIRHVESTRQLQLQHVTAFASQNAQISVANTNTTLHQQRDIQALDQSANIQRCAMLTQRQCVTRQNNTVVAETSGWRGRVVLINDLKSGVQQRHELLVLFQRRLVMHTAASENL